MLLAFACTAILPVFLFTPVAIGGTGFSLSQISAVIAIQGAGQAFWLLVAFPIMQVRYGSKRLLKMCASAYQYYVAGIVFLNLLLRVGTDSARAWAWILGILVPVVGPGASMAMTGAQLSINDVSPSRHVLATVNGLAMTSASVIRSFVPAASTVIFAVRVRNQILWGHRAWFILILLAIALRICTNYIPDHRSKL